MKTIPHTLLGKVPLPFAAKAAKAAMAVVAVVAFVAIVTVVTAVAPIAFVVGCGTKSGKSGQKKSLTTPKNAEETKSRSKNKPDTPEWGKGAEEEEPEKESAATGLVTFKKIGEGMVHLAVQTPGAHVPSGTGKGRKVWVLRDEDSYKSFISRLPEKTITKGPGRPNPDPLLKHPKVDFSKEMVVLVKYDFMWSPPKVKKVQKKDGKLIIQAEFKMNEAIMQHAHGVGSYTAIVVPRSDLSPALESP